MIVLGLHPRPPFNSLHHLSASSTLSSPWSHLWHLVIDLWLPLSRSIIIRQRFHLLKMDWQGQKLAEQLMQIMLLAFAVVAFAVGYIIGSFQMMILIYAGGVVLTTLVTVPNWPFFNRHPLKWLDPNEVEKHPKPQVSGSSSSKKKPTKK
ncbi:hypothetical protein L6164_010734 [Bauhinia variegata]|uniref:Uncharacterized protein n=1 Tax=Bauhinia variegata TaxID=167791 RepID=A0ACB9P342_BAUVA|nr:hypothetical protein L6164_010734 [Bauhinia variegata]